jgi:hypothetical protein
MPVKLLWTSAQDTRIRQMRSEGALWDAIAEALRLSRSTIIERGRRIGASRHPRTRSVTLFRPGIPGPGER